MSYCLIVQPIHEIGLEKLEAYGIEPRMASAPDMDTVAKEIGGAIACISRNAGFNRKAIEAAEKLLVFGNHGIGVDPVDVNYANEIALPIVFTPYSNLQSVAELAIGLMLAVGRHVPKFNTAVRTDNFMTRFEYAQHELWKKTLGIVGFGRIGRRTAEMCKAAFDMDVISYSLPIDELAMAEMGVRKCETLEELMSEADVVSLHLVLTPETRGMIDERALGAMKPDAIIVNTGRGACVDEKALIKALEERRILGAGLDVYESEAMDSGYALLQLDNVVLTPHAAGATVECLVRTAELLADQIKDVVDGKCPEFLINPQVWERRRIPS